MKTEIAIVGAGLSGLALALHLERAGRDYTIFEARKRIGGRIKTLRSQSGAFDLGPSWFWPGQPRMASLVDDLGLTVFDQYDKGAMVMEDDAGRVHRGMGFASMAGSHRLDGGMMALIEGLAARLEPERLHLGTPVVAVSKDQGLTLATGQRVPTDHVVLAIPPRVAAELLFDPDLGAARSILRATPTWMGGQAKALAVYETPFWRNQGLSGDAFSRHGPLVEIHDASGAEGTPAALFGFVGVPAAARRDQRQRLETAVLEQLTRLFGAAAAAPREIAVQDWAFKPETATPLDHEPLRDHPHYGMSAPLRDLWNGMLLFCVTELAPDFGGFLEGALAAAEATAARLGEQNH